MRKKVFETAELSTMKMDEQRCEQEWMEKQGLTGVGLAAMKSMFDEDIKLKEKMGLPAIEAAGVHHYAESTAMKMDEQRYEQEWIEKQGLTAMKSMLDDERMIKKAIGLDAIEKASVPYAELAAMKSMLDDERISTEIFVPPTNPNLASEFYERLVKWIQDFDDSLDQDHEVGIRLVSFGETVKFHLQDIGYWNPSLISFKGVTEQGNPVELIQNVSQISILLIKVQRQDTSQPKRPIGFVNNAENA